MKRTDAEKVPDLSPIADMAALGFDPVVMTPEHVLVPMFLRRKRLLCVACSFQSSFLQNSPSLASICRGIPTVPGKVTLQKDAQNLIGISIGGGAQYCPCLYIVQV